MKLKIYSIIFACALSLGVNAAEPQAGTGEKDGYKLVWQDLFDSGSLNRNRWNIEVNGDGGGNNELQYYTARTENVRVGDDGEGNGCLILTARRENYNGKNFTSGRVTTQGRIRFKHGKIEAAVKLPSTANGLWPAFWMMGDDIGSVGWPKCGETDIFEFGHSNGYNGRQDRFFNGASHWGPRWDQHYQYAREKTADYSLQDGKFHIYTCIWDENNISMYVDLDKYPNQDPYYVIGIGGSPNNDDKNVVNYFHKLNFILFNVAIGGNFPGIYDANGITALNNANGNQASMYINYVKIYQKGTPDEDNNFVDSGDADTGEQPDDPIVNPNPGDDPSDVKWVDPLSSRNLWVPCSKTLDNWTANQNWGTIDNPDFQWNGYDFTVTYPTKPGNLQWQAQVKINTNINIQASKAYDFHIEIEPASTINDATVKLTRPTPNDGIFFTDGRHSLQAGKNHVFEFVNQSGKDMPDFQLTFDFAGVEANAPIKVKNIIIQEHNAGATDGIADAAFDYSSPVEYYNLQGMPVAHPSAGGIYIMRQGSKVQKIAL